MKTILIADSGSTKTDWALVNVECSMLRSALPLGSSKNVECSMLKTQGINPFHMDEKTISDILENELKPQLSSLHQVPSTLHQVPSSLHQIYFYGSGVRPELEEKMVRLLKAAFPEAEQIEAKSDLLGAARALCGHEEGIACILGTGANSCLYDGQRIVQNTPALGYVLGDEGSGANLGIRFLNALYKNQLPAEIKEEFEQQGHTLSDIIDRVYRQPMANRFLASLSPFIHQHLEVPEVSALVENSFREFIQKNITAYGRKDLPVSAVGSVAFFYKEQLKKALENEGYMLGRILRSPIDGLVEMEQLG